MKVTGVLFPGVTLTYEGYRCTVSLSDIKLWTLQVYCFQNVYLRMSRFQNCYKCTVSLVSNWIQNGWDFHYRIWRFSVKKKKKLFVYWIIVKKKKKIFRVLNSLVVINFAQGVIFVIDLPVCHCLCYRCTVSDVIKDN